MGLCLVRSGLGETACKGAWFKGIGDRKQITCHYSQCLGYLK